MIAAPFPYFGGKRRAAPSVWRELGDPSGYVEPFAGSAAVLLARPRFDGRRVETINDADGWLINMWRAIQLRPSEVQPPTRTSAGRRSCWWRRRGPARSAPSKLEMCTQSGEPNCWCIPEQARPEAARAPESPGGSSEGKDSAPAPRAPQNGDAVSQRREGR
jgi:hypothetical protein